VGPKIRLGTEKSTHYPTQSRVYEKKRFKGKDKTLYWVEVISESDRALTVLGDEGTAWYHSDVIVLWGFDEGTGN